MKITCYECGHDIREHHSITGCFHVERTDRLDRVCMCTQKCQDVALQDRELFLEFLKEAVSRLTEYDRLFKDKAIEFIRELEKEGVK